MSLVQEADILQQSVQLRLHLCFRQTLHTAIKPHMLLYRQPERRRKYENISLIEI